MTDAGTGDRTGNRTGDHAGGAVGEIADLLLRVARKIQAVDPGDAVELTHLESLVMTRIDDEPGITPTELGAVLHLKSSNMSATLRSLETKSLIDRVRDADDGRVIRIFPTPFAAENLDRVREGWAGALTGLLPDAGENARLSGILHRLDAGLG